MLDENLPTEEQAASSALLLNLTEVSSKPITPPIDACAYRLDRLLGGGIAIFPSKGGAVKQQQGRGGKEEQLLVSNPAKIVRRWLGSSSGASGKATMDDVCKTAERILDPSLRGRAILIDLLGMESMEISGEEKKQEETVAATSVQVAHREVEAWLLSLAILRLYQAKRYQEALSLAQNAMDILQEHLDGVSYRNSSNKMTVLHSPALFPLLSRLYRYRALAAEAAYGSVASNRMYRADLIRAHRNACLRRDVDTQATALNLLLRGFLADHETEQAQKLLTNATFPTADASNNALCRFLYYSGHVQALRLEYTQSFSNLSTCLRKAPTNAGVGFRIAAQRLWIVVQLLMGEIPDRSVFYPSASSSEEAGSSDSKGATSVSAELKPYLKITQAVRRGDLKVFESTVSQYATQLHADGTFSLIARLSHSVVKAGLRKLNLSYSRISLTDVAQRLSLPTAANAEFVVAKAIRDGVIDATIDHEQQYVTSHELVDVLYTTEPMEAFHRRIAYCLTTHNDAMRGMRYRADAYKRELEAMRGKSSGVPEDDKTDEEKAQEMEDEFEEEF